MSVVLKGPKGAKKMVLEPDQINVRTSNQEANTSLATYQSWLTGSFLSRKMKIQFDQLTQGSQILGWRPVLLSADFAQFLTRGPVRDGEEVIITDMFDRRLVDRYNVYFSPVNVDGNHWVLLMVRLGSASKPGSYQFVIYDSLHPVETETRSPLEVYGGQLQIIKDWFTEQSPLAIKEQKWEVKFGETGHQGNGYDCGIWVYINFRRMLGWVITGEEVTSSPTPFEYRRRWRVQMHRDVMPFVRYVLNDRDVLNLPQNLFSPLQVATLKQSSLDVLKQQRLITLDSMSKIESFAEKLFDQMWICGCRIGMDLGTLETVTSEELGSNYTDISQQLIDFESDYKVEITLPEQNILLNPNEYKRKLDDVKYKIKRVETVKKFLRWYYKEMLEFIKYRDRVAVLITGRTISTIKDLRPAPINLGKTSSAAIEVYTSDEEEGGARRESPERVYERGSPQKQSVRINQQVQKAGVGGLRVEWPEDENIDVKLVLIENWVKEKFARVGERKKEREAKYLKFGEQVIKSGAPATKRELEEDVVKVEGSPLVLEEGGVLMNKPDNGDIFSFNVVKDKDARINYLSEVYKPLFDQVRRMRAVLETEKARNPWYIRSSLVAVVSNDAFRTLVLTDKEIYDGEVGLPPKYRMAGGKLEAVRRIDFKQKQEENKNRSWDNNVLSHNEAMVVAARFNCYYVVLALLKLYIDRRMMSLNAGTTDDPRFVKCDFDLFWRGAKALKTACKYGAYESALLLLNPILYRLSTVSANREKSYLSEPLKYKPIRTNMWKGFTRQEAEECKELLEGRQEVIQYREGLRKECIKRLNQIKPRRVQLGIQEIEMVGMTGRG
jgi:hypothetical protein